MRVLVVLLIVASCTRAEETKKKGGLLVEDDRPAPVEVVGVSPLDFRCDSLAPLDVATSTLAVELTQVEPMMSPPAGVPRSCVYAGPASAGPAEWSFDVDCRSNALSTGEALMVDLASQAGAQPVMIGRSGVDAAGSVLLFIDDDTPCYVRVVGPGADKRAGLARLIAERLTPRTAPGKVTYH